MTIVTLIARPGGLDPALVASLQSAWGGSEVEWLSEGEAACFRVAAVPGHRDQVWSDLQAQGVDLCVTDGPRRRRLLIADMDSTMIRQECLDELADYVGVGARVKAVTARAMNGELDFGAALEERVALLTGHPTCIVDAVLAERITYMPGGDILLRTMKRDGAYCALVSGGFTAFTAAVADQLGFDEHRANTLESDGDVLTGRVQKPYLGREAKVEALDQLTARLGLTDADVLAVGDGANDLGMLLRAGLGVAAHAKPAVQAEAKVAVNHGDLTALLFLQGYRREEFA